MPNSNPPTDSILRDALSEKFGGEKEVTAAAEAVLVAGERGYGTPLYVKFEEETSINCGSPSASYYWHRKRKEVVSLLRRHRETIAGLSHSVIDVGCGDGKDLSLIRETYASMGISGRFIGLDGQPAWLRMCELRRAHFMPGDTEFGPVDVNDRLPLSDASVGLAFCSEVVEHLEQPEILFKEVHRVLVPGGLFLLTTPNEPNIMQRPYWSSKQKARREGEKGQLRREPYIIRKANGQEIPIYKHINCRTNKEWDNLASKVGFVLIDVRRGPLLYGGNGVHDHPLFLAARMLVEGVLDFFPPRLVRNISEMVIALYRKT
jgi:SAM-dependent methyltransferase